MEWKSNFLRVLSERLAQRNNLLTIFWAIAVSWVFLTTSNPYDKLLREHKLSKLKERIVELMEQKTMTEKHILTQAQQLLDLNQQMLTTRTSCQKTLRTSK